MKYSTQDALRELNIDKNFLSRLHKEQLQDQGYCLIYISPEEWKSRGIDIELISQVVDDLISKEGWRGGWEHIKEKMVEGKHPEPGAQRLNNLIGKHDCFKNIFTIPEALIASELLIKNEICLSQLILRMPLPNQGAQPWHIDWVPRRKNSDPIRSVLTSFLLDDYTKANGTTRVVPGSHKFLKTPAEAGYYYQDHPDQKYIEAKKGSLLIYDINLWHCGTKNLNGQKRRHLNINYRDRKVWQQINFKKDLNESYKKRLNKAEAYLLKTREEDKNRNEWLFKNRNNFFIKKMMNFYWNNN